MDYAFPPRLHWLRRPKGFFTHHGVGVEHFAGIGYTTIFEHSEYGIQEASPLSFMAWQRGESIAMLDGEKAVEALKRLQDAQAELRPYSLISWNCEHFVRYVMTGELRSVQAATAVVGLTCLWLYLLGKR